MISPLLTDLYQLTMAYGYWKLGMHEREAVFHLIFRKHPFESHYAVACGLETVIEFLKNWQFSTSDLEYLSTLKASNSDPLFSPEFLDYLKELRFTCDVDAILEGTLVFPHEPLIRIKGPLLQGQLIESTLLNIINFQTLIATKAARVRQAAGKDPVLEFGLRRAQGPDGALSASRAAYIGGCDATSNVLAGKLYNIPVSGTHAHSWVIAFADEITAFSAYASVMPGNCVLLVDTYNTIQGVKHAIEVGKKLREQGAKLRGVRLDSGDMASLSHSARELLDAAGFSETKIIASNCLNEFVINDLKAQGAKISVWGVGTSLVTASDHPALDGVYKLSALRNDKGNWEYKLKLSEQALKISNPGIHQVKRFFKNGFEVMDIMYDIELGIDATPTAVSLADSQRELMIGDYDTAIDLLQPIFRAGLPVYKSESIQKIRDRSLQQIAQFVKSPAAKDYAVGLEKKLHDTKQYLIKKVSIS